MTTQEIITRIAQLCAHVGMHPVIENPFDTTSAAESIYPRAYIHYSGSRYEFANQDAHSYDGDRIDSISVDIATHCPDTNSAVYRTQDAAAQLFAESLIYYLRRERGFEVDSVSSDSSIPPDENLAYYTLNLSIRSPLIKQNCICHVLPSPHPPLCPPTTQPIIWHWDNTEKQVVVKLPPDLLAANPVSVVLNVTENGNSTTAHSPLSNNITWKPQPTTNQTYTILDLRYYHPDGCLQAAVATLHWESGCTLTTPNTTCGFFIPIHDLNDTPTPC